MKSCLPVAGFGTRFLPATKAMPKELLPIVDKPLIQYAEEAIAAGINTLIFVTGRNKRAIEDHFDANNELEAMLRSRGNYAQADMVRNITPKALNVYLYVRLSSWVVHAVLCAERAVGSDPFATLADDFLTDHELGVTADLCVHLRIVANHNFRLCRLMGLIYQNMVSLCLMVQVLVSWD